MKKLLYFVVSLLVFIPSNSFAAMGGGGGGGGGIPPPFQNNCYFNYWLQNDDNIFQDYQSKEYVNGLLRIHLKVNGNQAGYSNINHYLVLYDSNCNEYFYYADLSLDPVLNIPPNVSDISLRFVSPTHFQVWNDSTNQILDCLQCDVDLVSYGFPSGLRASFRLQISDYVNHMWDWVNSEGFFVEDPNFQQKNPVLIIPGTLGTEMWKGSEKLWPDVERMTSLTHSSDAFMDPLAFKSDGTPLDTSLRLGEVVGKPRPEFDYAESFIQDLQSLGYENNKNLILFPYDWRDDIAKNANIFLKQKIDDILASSAFSKIDVVAHSQGGLLIKRLLFDRPDYQSKINKLVFVGTPNLGAPKSAKMLLYGDSLGIEKWRIGLDPQEMKKLSKNMPAVYQMLPSRSYFDHNEGYLSALVHGTKVTYPDYQQSIVGLKNPLYGLNSNLLDSAGIFHSENFDNMDFSGTGIGVYNIIGCETATIGKVLANDGGSELDLEYVAGDGTVPITSASNINGANNFFVLSNKDIHGTMLTQTSVSQKIINILTNKTSSVIGITSNPALCVYKGNKISVHSPVNLDIYDELGAHVGLNDNGSFEQDIEGVQYDILGHEKFAFLPSGHIYTVKLSATNNGTFNFYSEKIEATTVQSTAYYNSVPITSTSTAELVLNADNNQTINFTSDSRIISPSAILDSDQSQDLTPPVSTSTIVGLMGTTGFYRSNATVTLSSIDSVIPGRESQTSGVLSMQYSLDGGGFQVYADMSPIIIIDEGQHAIKFYSTDRAGNREPEQTIEFVIDKTPPELIIQFSPKLKDLEFTATDTLPSIITKDVLTNTKPFKVPSIKFKDSNSIITATDAAGNTIQLTLKDKDRKRLLKAEIKSLSYNGQAVEVSKNKLNFVWSFDKKDNLNFLLQNVQSKKNFNILATYNGKKTTLIGKDAKEHIFKSINGLVILKATTNKGDLSWSY